MQYVDSTNFVDKLKDKKHTIGYYVWDEPQSDSQMAEARRQMDILQELDPEALLFTVAVPDYNGDPERRKNPDGTTMLGDTWENGKYVAAICAGPTVLADLGITQGKRATCYPGCESQMGNAKVIANASCVQDGNVITGTSAGCAIPFALKLIEALKGKNAADTIAQQIVIR